MMFDMLKEFDSFLEKHVQDNFDWVTALSVYQYIYNTIHTTNPLVSNIIF